MNIIEIEQMIDRLNLFFRKQSSRLKIVGGITGTSIFRYTMECACEVYDFNKILIIDGCRDLTYLSKKPIENYWYFADLFIDMMADSIVPYDPLKPQILNPPFTTYPLLVEQYLMPYDLMVINNAQLIPPHFLRALTNSFCGRQTVLIVDPYDINGDLFEGDCITDSLEKLSKMQAYARFICGVDTRAIDKKAHGNLTQVNRVTRRTIGRDNGKFYFTNDPEFARLTWDVQCDLPFRRNQKIMIDTEKLNIQIGKGARPYAITKPTICILEAGTLSNDDVECKIYLSKQKFTRKLSYTELSRRSDIIKVKPANIMTLEDAIHHRYRNGVLVCSPTIQMTPRERYAIVKCCNSITVATKMKW